MKPLKLTIESELKLCSLSARGMWLSLIESMTHAVHVGKLVTADGVTPWTDHQIIDSVPGGDRPEKLIALGELERAGVFKRDSNGVLYSVSLTKQARATAVKAASGRKGGQKTAAKAAAVKPRVPKTDAPLTAEEFVNGGDIDTPSPEEKPKKKSKPREVPVSAMQVIVDEWNAVGPIKCKHLNDSYRATLATRIRDPWWSENWPKAIERIPDLPFLLGKNDKGWKADFSWFIQKASVQKIIEGKYVAEVKPRSLFEKPVVGSKTEDWLNSQLESGVR